MTQTRIPFSKVKSKGALIFGAAALLDGDWVYIYGNDTRPEVRPSTVPGLTVLARAPLGDLGNFKKWSFFSKGRWQSDFKKVTAIAPGFASEFSVSRMFDGRQYAAVYSEGIGGRIVLRLAPAPEGPWSSLVEAYRTPEVTWSPSVFTYAGKAHPELASAPDELVITYAAKLVVVCQPVQRRAPVLAAVRPGPAQVGLRSRHLDQTRVLARDAAAALGRDEKRVFDAHHAEPRDALLRFERHDHALGQGLVEPLRDGGRLVHLQSNPVAEEVDAAVAESHEIAEEIGVELAHDGGVDFRRDGARLEPGGELVLKFDAAAVGGQGRRGRRTPEHIGHGLVGVITGDAAADIDEYQVAGSQGSGAAAQNRRGRLKPKAPARPVETGRTQRVLPEPDLPQEECRCRTWRTGQSPDGLPEPAARAVRTRARPR